MDINLLLNSAESEPCETTNRTKSLIPQSGQSTEQITTTINSATYLISYQTRNLRHGSCTIHPTSPPQRRTFSPEEDALMQYMIDKIQSGRVTILGLCLKRGRLAINMRWNVLDDYVPCSRCIQCRQYQKKADELRRWYVPLPSF